MKKQKVENKCLNIDSEKIEEMFTSAIKDIAIKSKDKINLEEIESVVEKNFTTGIIKILVTVCGLAGTATKREIHDKKNNFIAKDFKNVDIDGSIFKLSDSYDLNTNDYVLVYINE